MHQQKNFFKIYRQFGHAPSKRFASPALYDHSGVNLIFWLG